MRLLITGSNGFIGSHLVAHAGQRGWQVVGVGRQAGPTSPVRRYLRQDLGTGLTCPHEVDAVIHCAALASPWAAPDAFTRANVTATAHVLDWASRHGAPPLVYISTSSVSYRRADQLGIDEDTRLPAPADQMNAYSRTKLAGERLVQDYPGPWTILRPRAVVGPGDTVLLPRLVAAAHRGRLPIFTRRDGTQVRSDLTDVDTVAHYALTALERQVTGTYYLTNGQPVDLYPFLARVLLRLGVPVPTRRMPVGLALTLAGMSEQVSARLLSYREPPITRFGVAMFAWSKTFDITRARTALGPPLVELDETVERLAAWWQRAPHA